MLAGLFLLTAVLGGCGKTAPDKEEPVQSVQEPAPVSEPAPEPEVAPEIPEEAAAVLTDEQAVKAIAYYCLAGNPDLQSIVDAGQYPVYWTVESGSDDQVVVLYRSYTGALVRYYIDRDSGDTYVTEFVEGITPEEERTAESFNVNAYLAG